MVAVPLDWIAQAPVALTVFCLQPSNKAFLGPGNWESRTGRGGNRVLPADGGEGGEGGEEGKRERLEEARTGEDRREREAWLFRFRPSPIRALEEDDDQEQDVTYYVLLQSVALLIDPRRRSASDFSDYHSLRGPRSEEARGLVGLLKSTIFPARGYRVRFGGGAESGLAS